MSCERGPVGEGQVVWGRWSSAIKHLLLAEDAVVSLHDLVVGRLNAAVDDLVTLELRHVRFGARAEALGC